MDEKILTALMGVIGAKPINVTINVYNGSTPLLQGEALSTLEPYKACVGCTGCGCDEDEDICDDDEDFEEDFEEDDDEEDCSDCNAVKFVTMWDALKTVVITQMPDSSPDKVKMLKLIANLEASILG